MIARDLEPEDFPFTIVVWRYDGEGVPTVADLEGAWQWAVTVLPPAPGKRVPLWIPSFADVGPVLVTTVAATGESATTGPYTAPPFGRG